MWYYRFQREFFCTTWILYDCSCLRSRIGMAVNHASRTHATNGSKVDIPPVPPRSHPGRTVIFRSSSYIQSSQISAAKQASAAPLFHPLIAPGSCPSSVQAKTSRRPLCGLVSFRFSRNHPLNATAPSMSIKRTARLELVDTFD